MKKLLLILALFPALSYATTYNSNGTQSDFDAKVATAVDGDTVTIAAGSFTWTGTSSISGKGIKVQGAGGGRVEGSSTTAVTFATGSRSFTIRSGSTITGFIASESIVVRDKFVAANTMTGTVTSWNGTTLVINVTSVAGSSPTNCWTFEMPATTIITNDLASGALIEVTKDATNSTEFSGIRFTSTYNNSNRYAINISGTGKVTLMHDMRFTNIGQPIRDNTNGSITWKCYFDVGFNISTDYNNVTNGLIITQNALTDSWTNPNTIGMNDPTGLLNVYIEQCFFTGMVGGCVDCGDNFRGVIRYCVMDNSGIVTHGMDTDPYGVRQAEIYNNLFIFDPLSNPLVPANINYWFTWRGGSGIITDNEMDNISSWAWGSKQAVTMYEQALGRRYTAFPGDMGWPGGLDGTVVRYPACHQVGQGSNGAAAWYTSAGSPAIFTATNTYVEGVYIYSNTGSPSAGVGTYPNEIPGLTPDRDVADYIQLNRDYFTAAPGVGTPYYGYTKYTYPNPNRTDGGSTTGGSSLGGVLTLGGKITIN